MSKPLRVVGVQIKDVLGASEFNLEPGRLTVLAGRNGSGKSTALQAVQAALQGGNLCKLARVGAAEDAEPEVVLVIEGEGSESYRVERKGDKVRVRARVGDTAAFEDVGKPQSWLRSLYDPQGANPVTFLTAADKDRALLLLEALPLSHNRAELLLQMGIRAEELRPIPDRLHPLEEIGMIRDQVFTTRTGVNRDAKGKRSAAEQTRRSTPAVIPDDPGSTAEVDAEAVCSRLEREIAREDEQAAAAESAAVQAARHAAEQVDVETVGKFKTEAAKLRAQHDREAAEIRAEAERQIAAKLAEVEASVAELREQGEIQIADAERIRDEAIHAAAQAREDARQTIGVKREVLSRKRAHLAGIRTQRELSAAARALADQTKQFDDEAGALEKESERLTAAIEALDKYRRKLAENIPIPGLEIAGKEIRVDGVLFEQLNTAQRVEIAVKVACLRAKGQRLPAIFIDQAEQLDAEHFDLLCSELEKAGVQAWIGRVEDHDLTVLTDDQITETHA